MVSWMALRGLVKRDAKRARARNPDKTVAEAASRAKTVRLGGNFHENGMIGAVDAETHHVPGVHVIKQKGRSIEEGVEKEMPWPM